VNINQMTRRQFNELPRREDWSKEVQCDCLIILPAQCDWLGVIRYHIKRLLARAFRLEPPRECEIGHLHDSGYRRMDFVAVKDGEPVCRLAGGSDMLHIEGIGGLGYRWLEKHGGCPPFLVPPAGWSIVCLPKSGLLRMFSRNDNMICGSALSSFQIYALPRKPIIEEET